MSTILNSLSRTASLRKDTQSQAPSHQPSRVGVKGLSVMLLAAAVAALVVLADRYVSVWTDGHLFFGWVALWAVVFAGLALFAGTARNLATGAMGGLDKWSQSMANARAEARMWDIAKSDPRIMSELMVARMRDADAQQAVDFEQALAPLGFEAPAAAVVGEATSGWGRFPERLAEARSHRMHLYYI